MILRTTYQYVPICTALSQAPKQTCFVDNFNKLARWCTALYLHRTRWYTAVQDGSRWHKAVHELYKVVQGGKRWRKNGSEQYIQVHPGMHCDVLIQYIPVHPGTYCDVPILIAQPGYASLLDLLLHFYPVWNAVFETNVFQLTWFVQQYGRRRSLPKLEGHVFQILKSISGTLQAAH